MASFKVMFFVALCAFAAVVYAEERVKKAAIYPYAAYPYAAAPYPYAAYPYAAHAAYPYAAYPYAKAVYGHDDGSYFAGKYDPYY